MKIGSPKFLGLKTSIFWAKIQTPQSSDGCCAETRTNSQKIKRTGITAISRLPSHPTLMKFDRRLINCAFSPTAVQRDNGSVISRNRQHVAYRITSRVRVHGLSDLVAFWGLLPRFIHFCHFLQRGPRLLSTSDRCGHGIRKYERLFCAKLCQTALNVIEWLYLVSSDLEWLWVD